jgi:diguanylate cyclase (GGDEF)-like protein
MRGKVGRILHPRSGVALLSVVLLSCLPSTVFAASQMLFTQLGADENLSQGSILAIVQDTKGFLWFGTEDGLNRYDGYDFEHITRGRDANANLPNNWVAALAEDVQGRMWIGTSGGGVVWRDPSDGLFHQPVTRDGKALVDARADVRALRFDRRGRLWIGTRNAGLRVVDPQSGVSHDYRRDLANAASLSDDSVFAIREDAAGTLWIATLAGVDRLEPTSGQITRFGDRLRLLAGPKTEHVTVKDLRIDARGTVWMGADVGLARFDPLSGSLELLRHETADPTSLPNDQVSAILEDDEQRLWIGTNDGLALLNRRTGHFTTFRNDSGDPASLPDNHVVTLFQDRSGLLWVGTKSGGLARWNPRSWAFGQQRLGNMGDDNVTSFAEDRRGMLWVGTLGAGLVAVNRVTGEVSRYRHDPRDRAILGDDNVMALAVDDRDRVWIGTMQSGVERLDPRTGRIVRFGYDAHNPDSLAAPGVMSLLRDSRGRIWVGTYGGGLARIDPVTDRVFRYPILGDGGSGLSSDRATALAEDRAGLIWIGTDGGGLNVLDPALDRFGRFLHAPDNPQSLSSNTVYALHIDERGVLWAGTRGGGLDQLVGTPFRADAAYFKNFSERDGLPNSTVYGIESDPSGQLWLSTNRGLARFNPRDSSFRNFVRSNGLQGDEFNFGAHYRSPGGELFFGGPHGYNGFFADQLRFDESAPPMVLTSFLKFNSPANLGHTPESLVAIKLGYRDDVITFQYAALDFTAPRQNRYAYRLEGFDRDWVQAGNARQATYTNLAGGHYVFRVRGANSDGTWNNKGLAVRLEVEAPPWARWWAFIIYGLMFALALYGVWAAQQRRLRREAAYSSRLAAEVGARTNELAQRNLQLEQANQRLLDASVTDPLTSLGNRRFLHNAVSAMLADDSGRAHRGAQSKFVLIILDLDYLKPINDEHGHEAGDRVLIQLADILKHLCRTTDIVVRWGGDEFVMLCEGADLSAAAIMAERIRSSVAKQLFRLQEGSVARTSCSLGFAPFPFIAAAPDSTTWEQALALADAALFEAKRERNDWVGWAGTALAAEIPKLLDAIQQDAEALQRQGILDVRRRNILGDETVDNLRAWPGGGRGTPK